jgi:hypothetical protein
MGCFVIAKTKPSELAGHSDSPSTAMNRDRRKRACTTQQDYELAVEELLRASGIPEGTEYEVTLRHETYCVAWSGQNACGCHPDLMIQIPGYMATVSSAEERPEVLQ